MVPQDAKLPSLELVRLYLVCKSAQQIAVRRTSYIYLIDQREGVEKEFRDMGQLKPEFSTAHIHNALRFQFPATVNRCVPYHFILLKYHGSPVVQDQHVCRGREWDCPS